jgi:hypothetical protein
MAQTAQIALEYLMTVHADLSPPQIIDAGSRIVNVKGGWAEGPGIKAKVLAPGGDWLQPLPSGVTRIDVRLTVLTDDEQSIFISYNGVIAHQPMALTSWSLRRFGPAPKNMRGSTACRRLARWCGFRSIPPTDSSNTISSWFAEASQRKGAMRRPGPGRTGRLFALSCEPGMPIMKDHPVHRSKTQVRLNATY